tara:strand:+ start:371 stop:658 length:288 start_codon:yes stop_codon:yes gene_type:complete
MSRLDKEPIFKELMSLPTQNYWVTFIYCNKKRPNKHLYFSFAQFDVEPYFPRVNRFFDFCIENMKQFDFIDFEIIKYKNKIPRYQENIEKEFTIH